LIKWLNKLKDRGIQARVVLRLKKITTGHFGDFKKISNDLFELRFFFASGLRVYFTIQNNRVVFLLNGGDKSSQKADIVKAKQMLSELE